MAYERLSNKRNAGLAMMWKEDIELQLRSMSLHQMDFDVLDKVGDVKWHMTKIYGWPDKEEEEKT